MDRIGVTTSMSSNMFIGPDNPDNCQGCIGCALLADNVDDMVCVDCDGCPTVGFSQHVENTVAIDIGCHMDATVTNGIIDLIHQTDIVENWQRVEHV